MRKLILALLLLALSVPASAEDRLAWGGSMMMVGGTAAAGGTPDECTGKLICENAEGVGTPAGWTDTGTIDWDSTSSPLRGAQSVVIDATEAILSPSVAGGGDFWGFARFRVADGQPSTTNYVLNIRDSSNAALYRLATMTTGVIRHYNGTANQSTGVILADGSSGDYCVWFHAIRGAGTTNGEAHTWFDLCSNVCSGGTCTRPVSETITAVTAGTWDTGDADADHFYVIAQGTSNVVTLDQILVSTSEISSVAE